MVQHRRFAFSLNPDVPAYASVFAICLSLFLGLVRFLIIDRADPLHCEALVTRGRWLDTGFKNWQPDGCMVHNYKPSDADTCMRSKSVVFIGDSVTRKLFFQFSNILDPTLPSAPPNSDTKHSDHKLRSKSGVDFSFYWDPFLNSSHASSIIAGVPLSRPSRPAMLVIGSGLWYLRYAQDSGGLPAWEVKMKTLLDGVSRTSSQLADQVVILPVEDIIDTKLSPERAATMLGSDLDAMNSDLFHRIHPDSSGYFTYFAPAQPAVPITLPTAFNHMLDASQTADGLHFSDSVVRAQANLLYNSHCNEYLPKTFPLDKTCCRSYPHLSLLHFITLAALISWGPCTFLLNRRYGRRPTGSSLVTEDELPSLVVSGSIALIYLADRTGFWLKEQKNFDGWTFTLVNLLCLAIGLATVKQSDKDLGFLNRDQTDEWKGWMQIAILIYHYYGASKISGVYNVIRVLVASYLFMTGYGHTTFYLKKADFSFTRMAQIVIRINLYTLFLAYTMNSDYIGYYFSPLVTMWYFIIYATLAVGAQHNDRTPFLLAKVLFSAAVMTWIMGEHWLLVAAFDALDQFCGIHWSAKDWAFRVNLDLWIVYVGMLAAILVIKLREHRITDLPQWPYAVKIAAISSGFILFWFFTFELTQPDKFVYNTWHPYISFLPVLAFVILRNANAILRSASSRAFIFIGRCSLETFVIQYHLWLAADTRGILIVIPWTHWRSLNLVLTTVMFVFVSHHVANATGEITSWLCGTSNARKTLPTSSSRHDRDGAQAAQLPDDGIELKDSEQRSTDPPTPRRAHWVERLADGTSPSPSLRLWYGDTEWQPGVGTKLVIGLCFMWALNMLWPYPVSRT